jgi:hypothetical protein
LPPIHAGSALIASIDICRQIRLRPAISTALQANGASRSANPG